MNNESVVKVIILSEQSLYIDALCMLLNSMSGEFNASGYSMQSPATEAILKAQNPKVILMDANGMGKHVWEYLADAHKKFPETKIIMLANSNEPIYLDYANKNGAAGYVLKTSPQELLLASIKIALAGGTFFDPGVKAYNKNGYHHKIQEDYKLSARELEVISLIREGHSSRNIAEMLDLSIHTIEAHRKKIYAKLKINKVADLIRIFSEYGE
jgi:DNA-binding NarL/FixJ family response regulator